MMDVDDGRANESPVGLPEAVPDAAEQALVVKELLAVHPMADGQAWYLVSSLWWRSWKIYTGFREAFTDVSRSVGLKSCIPGPIRNDDIEGTDRSLRCYLQDGYNFKLLPEPVWDKLVAWYGLDSMSRVHRRFAHDIGGKCEVEVYLLKLYYSLRGTPPRSFSRTLECSRYWTVAQLREKLAVLLELPVTDADHIRLWKSTVLPLNKQTQTLGAANLKALDKVEVEVKDSNEDWTTPQCAGHSATFASNSYASGSSVADYSHDAYATSVGPNHSNKYSGLSSSASLDENGYLGAAATSAAPTSTTIALGSSTRWGGNTYGARVGNVPVPTYVAGKCGLGNLGNTCFMNSALQCLSNTPQLTAYFADGRHLKDLNLDNPIGCHGELAEAYGQLLERLWSGKERSVAPHELKGVIGRFAPAFRGFQQHDAQELLAFLLDGLHEDLNRVRKKPSVAPVESEGRRPDQEVATLSWQAHQARNDSIIVDLFHGQFKSTVVCPECDRVSITFDPFMYLSLPLPDKQDRVLKIRVVWADLHRVPCLYGVRVFRSATTADVLQALGTLAQANPEHLQLVETYNYRMERVFELGESVQEIMDTDELSAYENVPMPGVVYVPLFVRSISQDLYYNSPYTRSTTGYLPARGVAKLVMQPLMVPVSRDTSVRELYELICLHTSRYIVGVPPISSSSDSDGGYHGGTEAKSDDGDRGLEFRYNANNHMAVDGIGVDAGLSEPTAAAAAAGVTMCAPSQRYTFSLHSVNNSGTTTLEALPVSEARLDGQLETLRLGMDFETRYMSQWMNGRAQDLEQHSSVQLQATRHVPAVSLNECLDLFEQQEVLQADNAWYCSQCKKHQQATKQLQLWSLPDNLVVHLKRFCYAAHFREKLNTVVDFPIRGLDLSARVRGPQTERAADIIYDLYGVSHHSGSMGFGHYTAHAHNFKTGDWYEFDDTQVSPASAEDAKAASSYVLFYKRRTAEGESIATALGDTSPDRPASNARI